MPHCGLRRRKKHLVSSCHLGTLFFFVKFANALLVRSARCRWRCVDAGAGFSKSSQRVHRSVCNTRLQFFHRTAPDQPHSRVDSLPVGL